MYRVFLRPSLPFTLSPPLALSLTRLAPNVFDGDLGFDPSPCLFWLSFILTLTFYTFYGPDFTVFFGCLFSDAPEITLTVNKDEIHEQDSVELRCKTSAFPEPLSIHWYRNDEPIKADDGQDVLELTKVSRKANGDMISCEVRNAVGVNRSTVALNVIYKPQFKTSDKPVMAVLGKFAS